MLEVWGSRNALHQKRLIFVLADAFMYVEVTKMNEFDRIKEQIMEMICTAKHQRLRPSEAEKTVSQELGVSQFVAKEALNDLILEGQLVYAYRDPDSYVEFPCNGCEGGHRAARPMKVVTDSKGDPWLCDAHVDPSRDLEAQGCWSCGEIPFTRND
jgi:hypothetical protein